MGCFVGPIGAALKNVPLPVAPIPPELRDRFAVCPYFDLSRRAWIPCAIAWDPKTGRFTRVEG